MSRSNKEILGELIAELCFDKPRSKKMKRGTAQKVNGVPYYRTYAYQKRLRAEKEGVKYVPPMTKDERAAKKLRDSDREYMEREFNKFIIEKEDRERRAYESDYIRG